MAERQYLRPNPGKVVNPFGGKQFRAPGMTGTLADTNIGVDIAAPLGSEIMMTALAR
jgi:hypothetical protein